MDIILFEINNSKALNANQIIVLYLIYIFRFVSTEFYRELVFFVISYRDLLNSKGWQFIKENAEGGSDLMDIEDDFCERNGADIFPDFSNIFVKEFFVQSLHKNLKKNQM